jgi:hypothetical protein
METDTIEGMCVMSMPVLERMFENAFSLAEEHLRAEGHIAPMLCFLGAGGEAVLRLDLAGPAEQEQLLAKAQLMATALAAEACAWIFEGVLVAPGARPRPAVVALGEDQRDSGAAFAEIDAESAELRLVRFETPLAAAAAMDGVGPLARFIHRSEGENAAAEAWRELEAMGVNRSDGRRPFH